MEKDVLLNRVLNRARMDDSAISELMGLAQGVVADDVINQKEVEYIQKWITTNTNSADNPVAARLLDRIEDMLRDGVLDKAESAELLDTLERFSTGDFSPGEIQVATTLPLDDPAPKVLFKGKVFCLSGTFAIGARRDCEQAVGNAGARVASLEEGADYLVIGSYATDSWVHSAFGKDIEKAVALREAGESIAIVSELHWANFLPEWFQSR
jgi:NAD-dependent DNA ligase